MPDLLSDLTRAAETLAGGHFAAPGTTDGRAAGGLGPAGSLDAAAIVANAPDPMFVCDLEGKILQANDAVASLLGFHRDEVVEQSLSRFISPEEIREFIVALREVVERGVMRNVVLNPCSTSGEIIPTSLNASALRDAAGRVIGAIGTLRDRRASGEARHLEEMVVSLRAELEAWRHETQRLHHLLDRALAAPGRQSQPQRAPESVGSQHEEGRALPSERDGPPDPVQFRRPSAPPAERYGDPPERPLS